MASLRSARMRRRRGTGSGRTGARVCHCARSACLRTTRTVGSAARPAWSTSSCRPPGRRGRPFCGCGATGRRSCLPPTRATARPTGRTMADDGAGGAAALSPGRPTGDALWDDWDTPPRVPAAPVLHLDGFDGPIDLLLDLAERQQLDLGRISIVDLVDQFVAASMRIAAHVSLERRADWLVMAAHLVLLRSRLLFPGSPEAAEDAQRDAARAVARLDALRFIRAAAAWLQARPQLGHDVFARPPPGRDPHVASYMALMEACLTVLRGPDAEPA